MPFRHFRRFRRQRCHQQGSAEVTQRIRVHAEPIEGKPVIRVLDVLLGKQQLNTAFPDGRFLRRLLTRNHQRCQEFKGVHAQIRPAALAVVPVVGIAEMVKQGIDLQLVDLAGLELIQRHRHHIGRRRLLHQRESRDLCRRRNPVHREYRQNDPLHRIGLAAACFPDQKEMRELDAFHAEMRFHKAACRPS